MENSGEGTKKRSIQLYCINLKSRPDRWERFIKQPGIQRLKQMYPFERFEGVNGKMIDIKNDDRVSLRTKRNILYQKRRDHEDLDSPGGVGCYLSHYAVWKKFLETDKERMILFEDDAEIPDDFPEKLESALNDLEEEGVTRPDVWILSLPFGIHMQRALDTSPIQYNGKWAYDVMGPNTGISMTRPAAKILIDNAFPIDGHVDHYMRRCAQMGMIVIGHHKDINLKQARLMKLDSDIAQKPRCEICNIPDTPTKKGYFILSQQGVTALTVCAATAGVLYALKMFSKK